jgi:hypothetical protein
VSKWTLKADAKPVRFVTLRCIDKGSTNYGIRRTYAWYFFTGILRATQSAKVGDLGIAVPYGVDRDTMVSYETGPEVGQVLKRRVHVFLIKDNTSDKPHLWRHLQ